MNNIEQTINLEQIKTIEGTKMFFNNIPEECRQNLMDVIKEQLFNKPDIKAIYKEKLLNKPNMTPTDKENMHKVIIYLEENEMDTLKNFKKLDAINYGSNYIEIGGVKFSREKLIPQVKFNDIPNEHGVFLSDDKSWVFKILYNGKEEYYFAADSYIMECEKQGKKAIIDEHIRKALKALPAEFSNERHFGPVHWHRGQNILGNILDLSMSGSVPWGTAKLHDGDDCGYLMSASLHRNGCNVLIFRFNKDKGQVENEFSDQWACPCLYIVE